MLSNMADDSKERGPMVLSGLPQASMKPMCFSGTLRFSFSTPKTEEKAHTS